MNSISFNFFKQMHIQVKLKSYTIKFPKNKFLVKILNLLIEYNFIRNYLILFNSNMKIKIYLYYLMQSKPTYNFCIPISKIFYLYSASRYILFLLKRDFPFGVFLLNTSKGLLMDIEGIQKYSIGGHILAWFS